MIKKIIVHCSDSPHGRDDGASDIHLWHTQRGWSGIGYHAVIKEDGTIEQGRPDYWQGAHANGHNKDTLGVCLIGRGEVDFSDKQYLSLTLWLVEKMEKYSLTIDDIIGHNEVSSKTCPNFPLRSWLKETIG